MDSGFRVLDSGLIQWNLDSRFHSLVGFRIPWAVFWIPRAKFSRIPDSTRQNFLRFRNPDSLTWVETVADPGKRLGGPGGPPPLISIISSPNWGPKSRKKVFLRPPLAPTPPPHFIGRLRVWIRLWPPMVDSHFSVFLVCQKQVVHPGLVDVQALLGQKTTSQPTREFKTANRQWHFNLNSDIPTTDIPDFVKWKRSRGADNTVLLCRCRGPFLERFGNFSGPKGNFKIKTCWIEAMFPAQNPFNFALLTDSQLLYHFQNYWNFDRECKNGKHKTAFSYRDFQKTAPRSYRVKRFRVKCYVENCENV